MTELVFDLAPVPTLAVQGSAARVPVARAFCVGRNYADHAREMGAEVERVAPFFFCKDARSLVCAEGEVVLPYPPMTSDFQHEMELVAVIGAPAWMAAPEQAIEVVWGYACGVDMTRRDLQQAARAKGQPWDFGKAFEKGAVVGPVVPAADFGEIGEQRITLAVDGVTRQNGRLDDMVWSIAELVSHLSRHYHLGPGDLVFTGTPAGVGPVVPGNVIEGTIDGLPPLRLVIGAPEG